MMLLESFAVTVTLPAVPAVVDDGKPDTLKTMPICCHGTEDDEAGRPGSYTQMRASEEVKGMAVRAYVIFCDGLMDVAVPMGEEQLLEAVSPQMLPAPPVPSRINTVAFVPSVVTLTSGTTLTP